jgi:hypothetical protein
MSLQEQHNNNLEIQRLCRMKLLEPGWAGELGRDELAYIKSELKKSPSLKRRWGFRPTAKRFSERQIRAVARDGISAKRKPVLASDVKRKKSCTGNNTQRAPDHLQTATKTDP